MIVQAGAFGEHMFVEARYTVGVDEYPGPIGDYTAPAVETREAGTSIGATHVHVHLPPATEILMHLTVERFVHEPSYAMPWPAAATHDTASGSQSIEQRGVEGNSDT